MAKSKKKANLITTNKVRLCYPSILEPKSWDDGKTEFSVIVMVPKSDTETITKLKTAIVKATKETFPNGKPRKFHMPLMTGKTWAEERDADPEPFQDYVVFKAKSGAEWPPTVVGPNPKERIEDKSLVYSGVNARVGVTCKGFNKVDKGVGFYLSLVQILPGGERLQTGIDAADYFEQETDFGEDDLDADALLDDDLDVDGDEDLDFT